MSPETHYARYTPAPGGGILYWLACGPIVYPLHDLDSFVSSTGTPFGPGKRWILSYWAFHPESIRLKSRIYQHLPPFGWTPTDRPILGQTAFEDLTWRYVALEEDCTADFSRFSFTPSVFHGLLYAALDVPEAVQLPAELLTIGPARVWVNGSLVTRFGRTFSYVATMRIPITLPLRAGLNDVFIQGTMIGWREARLAIGLRLHDPEHISVCVPLGDIPADEWHSAQRGLGHLGVPLYAFGERPATVTLDPQAPGSFTVDADVSTPLPENTPGSDTDPALSTAHARLPLAPGDSAPLPVTAEIAAGMCRLPGENSLILDLRPANGIPIHRTHSLWASTNHYSHKPYGDYDSCRREAVHHLARMTSGVFPAMAAIELGAAKVIEPDDIELACSFLEQRRDCADFYALELLALLFRLGGTPALRAAERSRIEQVFLGFKFWIDEPGLDGMCYITENHQILFHVTGYLAGSLWPDRTFSNSGFTGREQRARHRARIENWIKRRLQGGFSEWDSNAYLTMDVFAMLSLIEFADSARLREMASTLLHKIFFTIACQSFRGAHASTHGRCYVEGLKSARAENTSSLQRIAWGMGIFNGEVRATGLLALARRYRVPDVIQRVGADVARPVVTRARSCAAYRPQFDMRRGTWDVRTVTYRTGDGMLSAAVDHRPGQMGIQEHLWQATLGPEAVVFTNYPGNSQEHGNARPNFWAGSARLPRVALYERTVICLYDVQPDVGLGFAHAYFPTAAFDEYHVEGTWAFARKGQGYIALWGDGDLILTRGGRHAGQELRSPNAGRVWVCRLGSAATDGSFAGFCQLAARPPQADGRRVTWITPEGKSLAFGWEGPLEVDQRPQTWDDFPHYENAYTQTPLGAQCMLIRYADEELVLDLHRGKTLSQA